MQQSVKHQVSNGCGQLWLLMFTLGPRQEVVQTYTREEGKGWKNAEGRESSMRLDHGSGRRGRQSYLQVHNVEDCERECTVTDPCVAYTFIPMVHRCDLKTSSDATSLDNVGGSVVSGRLNGERPPPPESQQRIINSTVCLPCLPSELIFGGRPVKGGKPNHIYLT